MANPGRASTKQPTSKGMGGGVLERLTTVVASATWLYQGSSRQSFVETRWPHGLHLEQPCAKQGKTGGGRSRRQLAVRGNPARQDRMSINQNASKYFRNRKTSSSLKNNEGRYHPRHATGTADWQGLESFFFSSLEPSDTFLDALLLQLARCFSAGQGN